MTRFALSVAIVALTLTVSACGGKTSADNPVGPTPIPEPVPNPKPPPTPNPNPEPTSVILTGAVRNSSNTMIQDATVKILDGVNAEKSVTTVNGAYRFEGLTVGNGNLSAKAVGYEEVRAGVYINGSNTLDFTLEPANYAGTWVGHGAGTASDGSPVSVEIELQIVGSNGNFVIDVWSVAYHFRDSTHPDPDVSRDVCRRRSPFIDRQNIPVIGNSFERNRGQNDIFAYTPTVFKGRFVSANQVTGTVTLERTSYSYMSGCPHSATVEWTGTRR